MIDRLKVSRVVNADLDRCHSLVADVESYGSWVSDLREVSVQGRDEEGRVTEARFRVAAMGRSASYSLLYDYSESPAVIKWQLASGTSSNASTAVIGLAASPKSPNRPR